MTRNEKVTWATGVKEVDRSERVIVPYSSRTSSALTCVLPSSFLESCGLLEKKV